MKRMQFKGFKISERKDGSYKVSYDSFFGHYERVYKDFCDAGEWVYGMADNHDIGCAVNHRMCEVFGKTFGDPWACIGF